MLEKKYEAISRMRSSFERSKELAKRIKRIKEKTKDKSILVLLIKNATKEMWKHIKKIKEAIEKVGFLQVVIATLLGSFGISEFVPELTAIFSKYQIPLVTVLLSGWILFTVMKVFFMMQNIQHEEYCHYRLLKRFHPYLEELENENFEEMEEVLKSLESGQDVRIDFEKIKEYIIGVNKLQAALEKRLRHFVSAVAKNMERMQTTGKLKPENLDLLDIPFVIFEKRGDVLTNIFESSSLINYPEEMELNTDETVAAKIFMQEDKVFFRFDRHVLIFELGKLEEEERFAVIGLFQQDFIEFVYNVFSVFVKYL